jgi:Phytanoyl-CoA dioxygenase (PhyH)
MLTGQQVDHYQTFGFVVLPGYLGERETADLGTELDQALRDGYCAHFGDRDASGGIFGHWLPMMSGQRTPVSLALVEDARFLGAAGQLLGARALPAYAQGYLLSGEAGLHTDCGTRSRGVKFAAYLEPLTAASGALRLMAGSHHADFGAAVAAWETRNPAMDAGQLRRKITGLPCHPAETRPGDVIAFSWRTWHVSIGGRARHQWTISYASDPRTIGEAERLRQFFQSVVPDGDEPYDHAAYPCYDEHWLAADPADPVRASLAERMRALGLFEIAHGR